MSKDKNDKDRDVRDDGGRHRREDFTRDGKPNPSRPVPAPPDPNKHDR